jgi:hypothetical protein
LFKSKQPGSDAPMKCSFCHKAECVVGKLISSPSDYPRAYICDECIAVCYSILEDDKPDAKRSSLDPAIEEIQGLRAQLRLLLDDIPDSDLSTVAKIFEGLIPR